MRGIKLMTDRILGLYNAREDVWERRAYLHSNSQGDVCVNGVFSRLVLKGAGLTFQDWGDYAIVTPPGFNAPLERYLAIDAKCLLWMDGNGRISVWKSGFASVSSELEVLRRIRVAVLTVSDKGSGGERADTAGPALVELIEALGAEAVIRDIVPDERALISGKLRDWADSGEIELILTTGGTGLSKRDITPEAIIDIQERAVPGFGEIMRIQSMAYTERGFLSRSLAAVRGGALIVAFPGSERAVRQCFEAIAPSIRHAVEMLSGWNSECARHVHR
jgi:molybdenum cofactor synthesis domain-containing protein